MKMNLSKKTLKILALVLVIGLVSTVVYATIMVTKHLTANFGLMISYGLSIYSDENCTVPLTTLNFIAGNQGVITYMDAWVKNEGNNGAKLSWNSTFLSWNEGTGAYVNVDYDLSLDYDIGGFHRFKSEHSSTPTVLDIARYQVIPLKFASKCYTDDPAHSLSVDVFMNLNSL